ncbi:MAG: hypothetical protein WBD55_03845 [Dehalococcoidia bacterium]
MKTKPTTDPNTAPLPALEEKKSRRGLLALMGAGGAAALAAAVGRDSPAEAAHDGTNVFHVGEENVALPGSTTTLTGNVADAVLTGLNPNPGTPDLVPVGVGGIASTSVIAMSGQGGAAELLRERLRDLRFFVSNVPTAAARDGSVSAQGVVGNGFGVFGGGDLVGVGGSGTYGVYGFGAVGVLGAGDNGGPGVVGVGTTGPGVAGESNSAPGVAGRSNTAAGVRGDGKTGVRGHASGNGKVGVHASAANRAIALKVEGGPLLLPKLSATQRNALSAVNGMLIYNTSVHRVQARVNGHWVNL